MGWGFFVVFGLFCFCFFFQFTMSKTPGFRVLNGFLMNGIVGLIKPGSVKT